MYNLEVDIMNKLLKLVITLVVTLVWISPAWARHIDLDVTPGSPYVQSDSKHVIPIKISLTGFNISATADRAPVNVSIVLDKSGSMGGKKIKQAREAAIEALRRLGREDIISFVTYDYGARVLVPATRFTDRYSVESKIRSISAGGSTALFAGVSKGAYELRKFIDREKANRVILLSDGIANVGPSSPGELGDLGASLARDGITVSTIGLGLGYNEDLMTELAARSDGNHAFVEDSYDLARIFQHEFGDLLSVVAQDLEITIRCARGFRPVRVLGRSADIHGRNVVVSLNQLYASQEKYIVLEVEVPKKSDGYSAKIADVSVNYHNMQTKRRDDLKETASVMFTDSASKVRRHAHKPTMESYYTQLANMRTKEAIALRDAGRIDDAKRVFESNAAMLGKNSALFGIPELQEEAAVYDQQADDLDTESWERQRKGLSKLEHEKTMQQAW